MSYDVALWFFSPSPVPMRECNVHALIFLKRKLKLNVKVKDSGMIDMLEKPSALGFLNRAEMQRIEAMATEMDRMDKIIEILRGKDDKCFSNFCDILKESNYETWAESLRQKAEEFERTPPGKCYSTSACKQALAV